MKIWEKVNNITGHSSKARYLVEYVNAGAKFILSSLPEKFLWTVATETEINGFDTSGNSEIGSGSKISYDKILAVYRYDSGKKRVCAEAPDKSIHIFDEGSSLLRATEMFPKFYKLGGKIFIKPDPDYNAHVGSGNAYQHAYTDLDGSTITVDIEQGGSTILSTLLTIDASEKTSYTAATPVVISDTTLTKNTEIKINIDQIGSGTAGKGLKVMFIVYKTP